MEQLDLVKYIEEKTEYIPEVIENKVLESPIDFGAIESIPVMEHKQTEEFPGFTPEDLQYINRGDGVKTSSILNCPLCASIMQLRTGKYGEFWSCIQYPGCRGTRKD